MGHGERGEEASRSETRHPPSEHQSVDDDVLEGRLAEQGGGQDQQGVEPGGQSTGRATDRVKAGAKAPWMLI